MYILYLKFEWSLGGIGAPCLEGYSFQLSFYLKKVAAPNQSFQTFHLCGHHFCCSDCRTGDIRLSGGRGPLEGRVEICYAGVWGTVCSNAWDIMDATVVCRQLQDPSSGAYIAPNLFIGLFVWFVCLKL